MFPVAPPASDDTPAGVPPSIIMGICTVAVLATALAIVAIVVCTWKEKEKEIDLAKPLILTEEAGKKKKKKGKKNEKLAKEQTMEEEELVPTGNASTMENEMPPRVVQTAPLSTEPKSSSGDVESPNDDSSDEASISDSIRYDSAT